MNTAGSLGTVIPESFHKVGLVGVIQQRDTSLGGYKLLLGQRLKKDEAYGKWVFPGGGLKGEETFEEGVKRECGEEVGLDIAVGDLIMATRSPHAGRMNVALIYFAYADPDTKPQASDEIGSPQFFTLHEAFKLDLMPATRTVLDKIVEIWGP